MIRRWLALALGLFLCAVLVCALGGPVRAGRPLGYQVQPGDTLPTIALRFGIPLDALLRAHGLSLHDTLYTSETLLVPVAPAAGEHTVAPGETLQTIAARYGVAPLQLAWRNGLADPQRLLAGQKLVIPDVSGETPTADTAIARPRAGQRVQGVLRVSGWGRSYDNELLVQVWGPEGALLAEMPVAVQAEIGQVGPFSVTLELPGSLPSGQVLSLTVSQRDRSSGTLQIADELALTAR